MAFGQRLTDRALGHAIAAKLLEIEFMQDDRAGAMQLLALQSP
jgi:hypothetical protein